MIGTDSFFEKQLEKSKFSEVRELPKADEIGISKRGEFPDISYIEHTSPAALMEHWALKMREISESKLEGLTAEEKAKIKEETGWSDEIIENIQNMKQYEILKNAGLVEVENGISNGDRIARGLAPLDSKTGKPIELHHLGQKPDSPLVELTEEEHRTGEYEDGKKNQSLWHDNTIESEVHGEDSNWDQIRKAHWKIRAETSKR